MLPTYLQNNHERKKEKKNGDGPLDFKETSVFLKSNGPSPFFFVKCKEEKNKQTSKRVKRKEKQNKNKTK